MEGAELLTTFQVHVAKVFFGLRASQGYVVAGGAALLASDLIDRPTQDIDLFASAPVTSVEEAKASLIRALDRRGYQVEVIHDSPSFSRLIVGNQGERVLVDLALDSPPSETPTMTLLGPTPAPRELAGRKLLALFGRAEARDFADVFVLAQRFGREALVRQAERMDIGSTSPSSPRCYRRWTGSPTRRFPWTRGPSPSSADFSPTGSGVSPIGAEVQVRRRREMLLWRASRRSKIKSSAACGLRLLDACGSE